MTKTELIRKLAKNSGIPDQDAKIFFELLLKRISSATKIGQSLFLNGFGYFNLIKGSIIKPVFGNDNNEVSEEEIDLILFSEESDLINSNTKGLVFSVPFADDDDFHPVDSAFSLSIGKPLIPLRGVPFDDIYIPTSGYEYRRLIESKVEKIISNAAITELAENFPVLVIDARSYNSNQVQLKWTETIDTEISDEILSDEQPVKETELSEYEKQTQELKNIAWDFGEDLSQQIEAESILDIADEKINFDLNLRKNEIADEINQEEFTEEKTETVLEDAFFEIDKPELTEPVQISSVENIDSDSSQKLDELLNLNDNADEIKSEESDIIFSEPVEMELIQSDISESNDELQVDEVKIDEIQIDEMHDDETPEQTIEIIETKDSEEDKQFWENTSKYFETYKPAKEHEDEENDETIISSDKEQVIETTDYSEEIHEDNYLSLSEADDHRIQDSQPETGIIDLSDDTAEYKGKEEEVVTEQTEQSTGYYEPVERKNYLPFIIFPLIVIVLSLALYWYLEYFQKKEVPQKNVNISLNTANTNVIKRDRDIPVSIPYPAQTVATELSESKVVPTEVEKEEVPKEEVVSEEKTEKKPEIKIEEKEIKPETPVKIPETKPITTNTALTNTKALNVGNNIFKYGDHYVVQVASFRSGSISENEAGKYRNKGYNAFVETAEIPERGTWYRVRVGNFITKEEAQNFINKNIRP